MTEMIKEKVVVPELTEPGDHERFSHYVNKDDLMNAMMNGHVIQALCGKKWLPTRDGMKFPVCPECKKRWEELEDV